jgi:chromatin remodeling complex protein RSC6
MVRTATTKTATEKVTKKTSEKKAVEKKEVAPATPAPENTVVESSEVSPLNAKFAEVGAKLQMAFGVLQSLKTEYKVLEKAVAKELKACQKLASKKKRSSGNRAPSGFVKPTLISDELATFLGKPKGSELARTDVSKEINAYIREHKLQDPKNGRNINADAKLAKLLKLGKEDKLTYFNLQRYMKHHFPKTGEKTGEKK